MLNVAITKAESRLAKAITAQGRLTASTSFREFEPAWADFLVALNGVYAALEQGAKETPQSRQWFGRKKRERREDPLLQYLHQARNADEHGLEPIAEDKTFRMTVIADPGVVVTGANMTIGGREYHMPKIDGNIQNPGILSVNFACLVTVKDTRFNTSFAPPTEHLGNVIEDTSPRGIAALGAQFHSSLVKEATSLIYAT